MSEPSKAVFLSYASQDAEAARRICEALRAGGIEVWFDQSELRGGDAWDQSIRRQIKTCGLFIPIISTNTHARGEGYFRLEWKLAVDRSHLISSDLPFLLPVAIDDTRDDDERAPERFRELQWTRLPGGETPPAFVERVRRLLSPEPSEASAPSSARSPLPSTSRPPTATVAPGKGLRLAPLLIAALALLSAGYFALDKFVLSKHSAASRPAESAPSTIPEKSIAVLPFVDMSERKDQEYFADGMAEEILNLLAKLPELKVIGRTSSFQFKGKTEDLRKIGAALGVAYVVEGSVRRASNHIRVTAQLIDSRNGAHRWSESYDRDADDVLKVQTEIAGGLVRALQLEVTPSMLFGSHTLPRSSEAYDLYLRGLHAAERYDQGGFEEAVVNFRRALELDPSFIPAAEMLVVNLGYIAQFTFVPPQRGWEQVHAAAEVALKLDPNSALVHAVLAGSYAQYDWNWLAATREARTAVALAPNDPTVLTWVSLQASDIEGIHFLETARVFDPLLPTIYELLCGAYQDVGRLAEAERACRRVLEISPTYAGAHSSLGDVLLMKGDAEAALIETQKDADPDFELALVYHALHRPKDADAALAHLETTQADNNAMGIADIYAFRDQREQAFKWLERAYQQKDGGLYFIKGDWHLKSVQSDPRYKAFVRKMNLPE